MIRAGLIHLSQFRRLQTKLTVLYAGLFGATLLLISVAVYLAISTAAQRQVRAELTASATVFDRVWSLRSEQLRQSASLLSRDFGFRAAVATGDRATTLSALENLRARVGIDLAFVVGVDGRLTASDAQILAPLAGQLLQTLNDREDASGVLILNGIPYQVISAPMLSPALAGWVVFAKRLDAREMGALEQLSAIPLKAVVLHRANKAWVAAAALPDQAVNRFIDRGLGQSGGKPQTLQSNGVNSIALVKSLTAFKADDATVLLLRYPLSLALAPYRPLLVTIAITSFLGLILVIWGSWGLARSLAKPVMALDDAVSRLTRGEEAAVTIESQDEIGRLAKSFNLMAAEIRERERRMTHQALHDDETGLPNRLSLERAIAARPGVGGLVVAVLGVDRFDHVRGAIGYGPAAQVILQVGERLARLAPQAAVARLSADLLGLALPTHSLQRAEAAILDLLAELEQPIHVAGDAIDVALTIGLAALEADQDPGHAIERANIGFDQARQSKRKIAAFDALAYGDPSSNLALMSGMLSGLRAGEMELHHQPKFDLRSRSSHATEGLVRWRHPVRGMLRPDLFIPMAEETGHIRALTDWVLDQAITDQAAMAKAGYAMDVSINISGRLLGDRDFADHVDQVIGRACGQFCFEITETAVIENPTVALEMLDRFRGAGIEISIDDFGSGLSSLAYLKQIGGHELKIDKSLITDVAESGRDALIVRSTIDLAHSLGMKVTAEGVEMANTFQLLAAMGCDSIQGYLIAKPQPLNELLMFLREDKPVNRHCG